MYSRVSFLACCLFYFSAVQADSVQLFDLIRTNYFPEKTMVYSLSYEASTCQFSKSPIRVYFVDSNNRDPLRDFSAQNKQYFYPNRLTVSGPQTLSFGTLSFDEMQAQAGKSIRLQVDLGGSPGACVATTQVLLNGKSAGMNLNQVKVKFVLKAYPLIAGLHPGGVEWLALIGRGSPSHLCLVGSCP